MLLRGILPKRHSIEDLTMHSELFTDGIGEITVSGSIVRVDLMSLSPTERNASNTPRSVLRQRVIFSIEGFANSVDLMQKALQGLVESGVVRRTADASCANEAPMQAPRAKGSPNF
jgi:hypothetical protein